ncbi:MAG: alcohol dehydrogenase [Gemmatimonadetes bacterium]|nr:MAG: alcohol dehydrogenase [Gemmatimonadota bacterium]PYO71716.1 MAG: alcohol dehydrogenase [Gemmatimonadota bacterium]TLY46226.1 MAG: NADP-dependent oxidoreductase [Gemmatimonadota bacterium]
MKAVRLHRRGGPEQLIYEDAPKPTPGPGDALVRVHACAITPTELSWGTTYTTREGVERLPTIPGHELSGVVEAVAPDASAPKVGEAVYALTDFWRDGAAADYVVVRAGDLAPKPKNLSHTQAAAVPLSALTAWQAFFDHARLTQGQRVLVHGAAGGVGTYAVQLAHGRGAHVIGTSRAVNTAFLRDLGCDEVIDYTTVRFEDRVRDADIVLDTVGGDTLERSWRVLRKGGVLVTIADSAPAEKAAQYGVRGVEFIVEPSRAQLIEIARLIETGALRVIVEATFPLPEARAAFVRSLGGHNRGKLVLQVAE